MRQVQKLTSVTVQRLKKRGLHADGRGLYLQVSANGSKAWTLRYQFAGRARYLGLGPLGTVGLAEARERADVARHLLLDGVDPIEARRAARAGAALDAAKAITFDAASAAYIKAHRPSWKNKKHAQQWENTLKTYASPVLGGLPIAAIHSGLIVQVLAPIWLSKAETASRLRMRLEAILSWATEPLAKLPAEYGPRSLFACNGVVLGSLSRLSLLI